MKKSFIKVALFGALTIAASCFTGCNDYDDDIKNLQGQVDELKSLSIADLESQLKSLKEADTNLAATSAALEAAIKEIKANLESLSQANEALKAVVDGKVDKSVYDAAIEALNGQCKDLAAKLSTLSELQAAVEALKADKADKSALDAINKAIEDLKVKDSELAKNLTDLQTNLQAAIDGKADKTALDALKTELQTAINTSAASVKAELEGKIAEVSAAVNELPTQADLNNVKEALETRIATLESGKGTWKDETEKNKQLIDNLTEIVTPLKGKVDIIAGNLETAEGNIAKLQTAVDAVQGKIDTAITNLENKLTSGAIKDVEDAYKLADTNLDRRIQTLEECKFGSKEEIEKHKASVKSLEETVYGKDGKGGLVKQYQDLKDQFDNLFKKGTTENGTFTTAVGSQITAALEEGGAIQKAINDAINAVTGRVSVLESQVADLMARIQSIVFVPQFTDASGVFAPAYFINNVGGEMSLSFRVSPADKAAELADMASKLAATDSPIFSFIVEDNALETRAVVEDLTINTITGKDGIITVTAIPNPTKFVNDKYFPTALKVSTSHLKDTKDSVTNITTEYFKVKGQTIAADNAKLVKYEYGIDYAQTAASMVNTDFTEQVTYYGSVTLPMTKATIGFDQQLEIYSINGIVIDENGKAVDSKKAKELETYLANNHFALDNNKGVKLTAHDPLDAGSKSISVKLKDATFGYDGKTPRAQFDVTYKIIKESVNKEYDYKEIKATPAVWASAANNVAKDYTADFLISNMSTLYADKNADAANVLKEMQTSDDDSKTKYYVKIGKNARKEVTSDDYKMKIDLTKDKGNVTIHMPKNYEWTSYIFETVYETSYGKITAKAELGLSYPGKETFLTAIPARWIENNKIYFVQYDKPESSVNDFTIVNILKGTDANAYEYNADADYTYELLESGKYSNITVEKDGKITVEGEIKYDNTDVNPAIHLTGDDAIKHVQIKVNVTVTDKKHKVADETFGIQLKYPMPTKIDVSKVNLIYTKADIKNKVAHNIAKGINMKDNYGWNTDMIKDGKITDYAKNTWKMTGNQSEYVNYEFISATQGLKESDFTISADGKLSINQINVAQDAEVTIKVFTTYKYGKSEGTFTITLEKTE